MILPQQKGLEFPGGWGGVLVLKDQNFQTMYEVNWNFQGDVYGGS